MEVSGIYDNGPITPIAKVGENLGLWTGARYDPYRIAWIEGIPESSPYTVDMITVLAAGPLAANTLSQKTVVTALQMDDKELLHARWEPVDYVEGLIWELASGPRYASKGGQARTSPFTHERDPWLATTTFFVLGLNKDANIGVYNPQMVATPQARFAFWGFRYILKVLPGKIDQYKPITYLPIQSY